MAFEQRQHQRIPDDSKAYIEVPGREEELVWEVYNISEGGAAFLTEEPIALGTEITILMMVEEALRGSNLLSIPGTIRVARDIKDGVYEIGVEFDFVSDEDMELLLHYISHRRPNRPI